MKPIRSILLIMLFAVATSAFAQVPQRFNYQAVARDASGNPISEKTLAVRISIVEGSAGGTSIYTEDFSPTTGKQGLFSIQIGGNVSFGSIDWKSGAKFLKVEIDPAGGSSFTLLGTSQLLSVPYAFAADKLSAPMPISELSDVSDVAPGADQVLRWNGTEWEPATVAGSGALVTSTSLSGNGTTEEPLSIAQQNATSGQVLQWNGTEWKPATINGGVGDNWGTQNVVTDETLSGVGTAAAPLGIARQDAGPGDVLKFDGSKWLPAADGGDNWGTAKVNTSTQFEGDGTPVNPLKLGQNSAEVGQVLKWSGTGWVPDDDGGSLTLPASAGVTDPGVGLQIQNNSGTGIVGINNSNTANVYGVQGRILNSTGAGTAGVFGKHGSTDINGYGVYGQHAGIGVGVYGEALGASGYGVRGDANGAAGVGVYGYSGGSEGFGLYGLGTTGVLGTTNNPTGAGIWGSAGNGGIAGLFDERVVIRSNSSDNVPTLYLRENETNDKPRMRFDNNQGGRFWDVSAGTTGNLNTEFFTIRHWSSNNVFTIDGNGAVGLGTSSPSAGTRLDVVGHMKISGGIVANGTLGTPGQVLTSNGGSAAQWKSPTNALWSNTYLFDQEAELNLNNNSNTIDGLANMSINLSGPAKVIFTFSHSQVTNMGGSDLDVQFNMAFTSPTATIINQAQVKEVIEAGKTRSISYTHHCSFGTGGQVLVFLGVVTNGQLKLAGRSGNISTGQVTVQVIPQ